MTTKTRLQSLKVANMMKKERGAQICIGKWSGPNKYCFQSTSYKTIHVDVTSIYRKIIYKEPDTLHYDWSIRSAKIY